jgi:hypothetical protein
MKSIKLCLANFPYPIPKIKRKKGEEDKGTPYTM